MRPEPHWYPFFEQIGEALGQPIHLDRLHLTLCVVAQSDERDRFVLPRVQRALREQPLHSFAVNLSRVVSGPAGAYARTFGRQDEIQDFYRLLVGLLRARGIEPLHRKAGLHPHITLRYAPCSDGMLPIVFQWFPVELQLIESEIGLTRHTVLGSWSLLPPRQPLLPLAAFLAPQIDGRLIAAAGPARRSCA